MKAITTALGGLALILASCTHGNNKDNHEQNVPPSAGVEISHVNQGNGISIPSYDWQIAQHHTLNLEEEGFLNQGYAAQGYARLGDETYDGVMDLADTNGDGNYDLIRVTIDSMIIQAPNLNEVEIGRASCRERV